MQTHVVVLVWAAIACAALNLPIRIKTHGAIQSRIANTHLEFQEQVEEPIEFTYGSCASINRVNSVLFISDRRAHDADRLTWIIPQEAESGGCLFAWGEDGKLLGQSDAQLLEHGSKHRADKPIVQKRSANKCSEPPIVMTNETGFDPYGAWFEGVEVLKHCNLSATDTKAAKAKHIAIVGAGMSGLMSFLVLFKAGFTNLSIIEASDRLGGRIDTQYLTGGPFDYSYQEMGPMRFPATYRDPTSNKTLNFSDHAMVFQLADEMNRLNKYNPDLRVDFIPWIENDENGLQYFNGFKLPSGFPPTTAQIQNNESVDPAPIIATKSQRDLLDAVLSALPGLDSQAQIVTDSFRAHSKFLVDGGLNGTKRGDQWSEFAFMVNYLKASLNDTDFIDTNYFFGVDMDTSSWEIISDDVFFSTYTSWKTIDGGLSRLPMSFHPLVDNVTTYNRPIERIQYDKQTNKVHLQSRPRPSSFSASTPPFHTTTHDYAIIAIPFSTLRSIRLPPLSPLLTRAIPNLPYTPACKVALEFSTRFWEKHLPHPIHGSCSTLTDIYGISSICYPSYNINGSGPRPCWPATTAAARRRGRWRGATRSTSGVCWRRLWRSMGSG